LQEEIFHIGGLGVQKIPGLGWHRFIPIYGIRSYGNRHENFALKMNFEFKEHWRAF
jgi:hypothetical protein